MIHILAEEEFPAGDYLIRGATVSIAVAGSKMDSAYGPGPGYPVYDSGGHDGFVELDPRGAPVLNSATGHWMIPGIFDLGRSAWLSEVPSSVWGLAPAEDTAPLGLSAAAWARVCPDAPGSERVFIDIGEGAGPVLYAGLLWTFDAMVYSRGTRVGYPGGTLVSITDEGLVCLSAGDDNLRISDVDGNVWATKSIDACTDLPDVGRDWVGLVLDSPTPSDEGEG